MVMERERPSLSANILKWPSVELLMMMAITAPAFWAFWTCVDAMRHVREWQCVRLHRPHVDGTMNIYNPILQRRRSSDTGPYMQTVGKP